MLSAGQYLQDPGFGPVSASPSDIGHVTQPDTWFSHLQTGEIKAVAS